MSRRGCAPSLSHRESARRQLRPQTAGGSAFRAPTPLRAGRSLTPPPRTGCGPSSDSILSPDDSARRASTPTRNALPSLNFLDDTNLSSISSSRRTEAQGTSRRAKDRLQELKQTKKDLNRAALVAEMHAVLASVELYEEQEAFKSSHEQAKLKLEMEKEEELIKKYSYCLETIPLCVKAQTAVDKVKSQRGAVYGMMGLKDSAPCSEEEVSKIRNDLETLKHSLDNVKSVLILKNVSLPLGELEKVLNQSVQNFEQSDLQQITGGMKKITALATLLDRTISDMEKIRDLLEEKDRLITHLTSLRMSMTLYDIKQKRSLTENTPSL